MTSKPQLKTQLSSTVTAATDTRALDAIRLGISQLQVEVPVRTNVGLLLLRVVLVDEAGRGGDGNSEATDAVS